MARRPPLNPAAANLDHRWPLPSVDMAYVLHENGQWHLRDFFGDTILASDDRSACHFKLVELNLQFAQRH